MKIAVWSSWINSEVSGEVNIGIEVIKALKKEGHEILVLSQMKSPSKGFLPEDISCVFLSSKKYSLFSFEAIKACLHFRKEIKEFRPDLILYIGSLWFFVLRQFLTFRDRKIKTIVWEHGNYFSLDKRKTLKLIARQTAAKRADRLVVLTKRDKEFYLANCNCKHDPIVIPNFIREQFIKGDSKSILCRKKQVLFVGRLDKNKQVDKLINIWQKVMQSKILDKWKLIVIGSGAEKKSLEETVKEKNLPKIEFFGHIQDPFNIFEDSQILVMTSKKEGLPLVLIEGLFCDLPLISFDCDCGPADIIDDGETGFLIPVGDENEFADRLSLLMQNDDLRLQFSQKTLVTRKRFLPETILPLWKDLINDLI